MKDNLKRSNSAKFSRKSHNYYETKGKHKKMSNIAQQKLAELNEEKNIKKQQQDNVINSGAYNNVINAGDGVVIKKGKKEDNNKKEDKNKKFNTLFTSSLLKVCGEPTITIGSMCNNSGDDLFYMDQAKGSLQTLFEQIFEKIEKQNADVNDFSDNEKQIICLFYLLRLLNTSDLYLSLSEKDKYNINIKAIFDQTLSELFSIFHPKKTSFKPEDLALEDWQKFFTTQNMEIIARHLFKVFLLYMYDRKPANLLVFDNKQKSKQEFVDADFDDVEFINCLFGKIATGYSNKEIFSYKIESIYFRFFILTNIMSESKYNEFSNCIKQIAKKFTFKTD